MSPKLRTLFSWIAVGIASHVMVFATGYYVSSTRAHAEIGQRALNSLMDELSALAYLEKGDVDRSRYLLMISLDSHVLTVHRFGTSEFDVGMPGAKKKWILEYEKIRKKYPAIDYPDDGAMNREVDRAFDTLRKSQTGKENRNGVNPGQTGQ